MSGSYRGGYEERMCMDSEEAPGGVIVYYADGGEEIIHANQYVVDLFECDSVEDFMEYTKGTFRNVVCHEDLNAAEDSIWGQVGRRVGFDHTYYRIRTKTGRIISVDDFGRLVAHEGERPRFYAFLVRMSKTDSVDWLTGLPDMPRFYDLLRMGFESLSRRGQRTAVIAFDVMGLKMYNARYGRDKGDELLRAFGDVLRRHFGSEACSRFAEDHFYAFASAEGAGEKLSAVFGDFAASQVVSAPPVRAGVYLCDTDDDVVLVGIDRARIACNLDRSTWESHAMWFTDEMRAAARLRVHVLKSVDQAIAEGWIRPYYQPIVRSATGCVCGEEALARWEDPEYGLLMPEQFVPVLEDAGLLRRVDMHMVDCVVADMRTKRERGVPVVPVSVNISLLDISHYRIADEVSRRADAAGVPRGLVRVEFTESVASSDSELFRTQVAALRAAGFEVWMDDFGSGYSSLNTLQEFDFDLIKLDMAFIRSERVDKSHVIVAGVTQAAGRLGVGTLAEGVETEAQAVFLESIGCDMLQGFFYARPQPLEEVIEQVRRGEALPREPFDEDAYWDSVSLLSLVDLPASDDDQRVGMSPMTEVPMGVVEYRGGTWHILRANPAYADFLDKTGMLPKPYSTLRANPVRARPDEEFFVAAGRSRETGLWERIMGHMEYGSGYQFFVRHVTSTSGAEAYMVAGSPTMLGSALGAFGDVPVAYAVFRVLLDETREHVEDIEYVYANVHYCRWGGYEQGDLPGRSFLEVAHHASRRWFPACYDAAVLRKHVHGVMYSPESQHWLSYNAAPTLIEGCCVFAFTFADDERREREEMMVGLDTSDLIISIADALGGETSYEVAMNSLLETMSTIIHPERLYVYERGATTTRNTFEWCAEGIESQIATLQDIDNEELAVWDRLLEEDSVITIDDVSKIALLDERLHRKLVRQGITRMLAVPFYNEGELLGYLGADNYRFEEGLDTRRLLGTVASFVGARVANHRLLEEMQRLGTYDALTGLLNRRGIDLAVAEHNKRRPDEPYTLALMDVDDFKTVNDLHGHDVGDEALRELARRVGDAFGHNAIVGRNGGDEFLVMLCGDDSLRADALFREFVDQEFSCELHGRTYRLSMSVGYASCPDQTCGLMELYTLADAALYAVKLGGKGGCARYAPSMETQFRSQLGFTPHDIARNIPGGILVHRQGDDEILFANDEIIELFECDGLEDFLSYTGGTFGGVVHPDDRDRVREELTEQVEMIDKGAKDFVDFRVLTKRGNVRHVADNGKRVLVEGVGVLFYELIVNRDERGVR